jgi:ABC-type oligopeptide transport system substrate-binding subunit
VTQFVSAEVDDLILRAASTAEDELRWDLLRQAEQAALSQWTVMPVVAAHNGLVQRRSDSPLVVRADGSIDASGLG